MPSVTQIVGAAHQPRKGYLPLSKFDEAEYIDGRSVVGNYNIHPSLVGLAVDYGTRLMLGTKPEEVFSVALAGASLVGSRKEADDILNNIKARFDRANGLEGQSIVDICKLSGFDSAFRAGAKAFRPVSEINPDEQTLSDIAVLIERTIEFFDKVGPVLDSGFTFEGAYSDKVESGDADYLTGDTIWDLKVRKAVPNKNSTLQVLLYYLLSLRSGKEDLKDIKKVGIYNPYLQRAWVVNVLDLDESMLKAVMDDVLGYKARHENESAISIPDAGSKTIYHVIEWIRETSETEREKGDKFERATRFFLKNDPIYSQRFNNVWMWKDAPTNDGSDLGIDLVALDAEDGTYWAIQCKCYQKPSLDYKDVATFYGKTGNQDTYGHNMIVTTCADFGPNLDKIATQWDTVRLFADGMAQSEIDWDAFMEGRGTSERKFKEPLPHQREAIDACIEGFSKTDRGQLIMACGTGKTVTSLRLTEELLPEGSLVLFLAPSIALVAQTMREWANQSKRPLRCAVVCSDATASSTEGDTWETSLSDIPYPATTDPEALYEQVEKFDRSTGLNVVFSTYQSIQVVSDAQHKGLDPFDLIVCDEAHRTTGASAISGDLKNQSEFTKVHNNRLVSAKKRVYMTATPKLYGDKARQQAKTESYEISSMDDVEKFGPVFYRLTFGRAVDEGLLTDYRVIALTVSEDVASDVYQMAMAMEDEFEITDAAKVIGCWKGLADQGKGTKGVALKNAVAFCSTIPESRRMAEYFQQTVNAYLEYENEQGNEVPMLECRVDHIDGTMDMASRKSKLRWLADVEDPDEDGGECHVLSNVRCLSEGVDVPNLDAIMFLQPKKSRVEVVQAVGRVMRKFEGKEYGYIILPVVIPAGMTPEEALDNTDAFKVVWEIVQALRSHDERLDGAINGLEYDPATTAVIDIINVTPKDAPPPKQEKGEAEGQNVPVMDGKTGQMKFDFSDKALQEAVNAVLVKKCGTKVYWEDWAKDIGEIAKRHIDRVGELVLDGGPASSEFAGFLRGLRDSLNEGITEDEAVEMLAQHMITLPVFEALFAGAEFASSNPVSIAMERMVETLREYGIETDAERHELANLYSSVRLRAEGVKTDGGRQKIIKELYEKFFSQAFKATSEKMGIVYTPNEVVDYILHATNKLLQEEFGQSLSDEGVNILDPFTGTGTFVVNLLQDEELMPPNQLPRKYRSEIWCNEILLLAYYIATINIEHAYHSRVPGEYVPFEGAVLTDTFQMYEDGDPIDLETFVDNTERIFREMEAPITVIVGNPPYSIGQKNANDNNQNMKYASLDAKISSTYSERSKAGLVKSLYDPYIRAFRWATERIDKEGKRGVICYVTNSGWLDAGSMDGFRESIYREFSDIYIFDLRGNQKSVNWRAEGGKIFDSGSQAGIAITLLVKNPDKDGNATIKYHAVEDGLTAAEKLAALRSHPFDPNDGSWETIVPNKHNDWINQRDEAYEDFIPMYSDDGHGVFSRITNGVVTNRDAWAFNYSEQQVADNMSSLVDIYMREQQRYNASDKTMPIRNFVDSDPSHIKWTADLLRKASNGEVIRFERDAIRPAAYRPFSKRYLYYSKVLNERAGLQGSYYPRRNTRNISIGFNSPGSTESFVFAVKDVANSSFGGSEGSQWVAKRWFDKKKPLGGLFAESQSIQSPVEQDGITDFALKLFREVYADEDITKDDIFDYVYGVLHSPEYKDRFASDLKKQIPRIPLSRNFEAFAKAGKRLLELHCNYENVDPYPLEEIWTGENHSYLVKKMKHPKHGKETNLNKIVYNDCLTLSGIPSRAYMYTIKGRSAIEWIIKEYAVQEDTKGKSGIINDPNHYSDDPAYIVTLLKRVVRISLDTMDIIDCLPPLKEIALPAGWQYA